jgi:hypothetical protein
MGKISIYSHFEHDEVCEEINTVLIEILSIRSNAKTETGYLYNLDIRSDFEGLELVLINILEEKTEIRDVFNKNKIYLQPTHIEKSLKNLDPKSESLCNDFLSNLNNLLKTKFASYSFLFPFNLTFEGEDAYSYIDDILDFFKLKRIKNGDLERILDKISIEQINSKSKYGIGALNRLNKENEFTKDDVINYLDNYNFVLFLELHAKSYEYAVREAEIKIESFLGFLSFAENVYYTRLFPFESNGRYNEIFYDEFVLLEKNRIAWPKKDMLSKLCQSTRKMIKFKRLSMLISIYKEIQETESQYILNLLKKLFSFYFSASSEDTINFSFLKFWITSETIIKGGGKGRDDSEVKSIMQSVIDDEILQKRIDFLHKKRDHLVHKGQPVTADERDLIKLITDALIVKTLLAMSKLNNKKEFIKFISNGMKI